MLLPREEGHSRRPGIKERRYDGKEKDGEDEEEFELNWRKNCWDHRRRSYVCSSLPHTRYRVKNVVAICTRYYLLVANYKLWQLLIPRDDLGAVFRVMVFLSMGHERPERRPETIAF